MTRQPVRFLKLDTGVVRNFDAVLGDRVTAVRTTTGTILRGLVREAGAGATIAAVWRALWRGGAGPLVAGNLERKRIRLPAVFGLAPVAAVYGGVKRFQAALLRELLERMLLRPEADGTVAIVYNGSLYPESVLAAVTGGRPRVFVEAGFFPGTLQIDPQGLNAANSVPRDPAFYLSQPDPAARGLPELVNNRPSKGRFPPVALEPGYVFVPFQVPSDMQVTVHSPWIRTMEAFLDLVRAAADRHPGERFVIKEHPSFKRSVIDRHPPHPRVTFANGNVTSDLIRNARAVLTLNSTVGIEGLLLGKPVIVLAEACYDINGLVRRARDVETLDAALADRTWRPDEALRRAFLGWLWNDYLVHGNYREPPPDLADQIIRRAGQA